MGVMAPIVGLAGAGLSAYGSIKAGQEASRASMWQKQQLEVESKNAAIAADQTEARRREDLTSSLEAIAVLRAGRGVGAASPTGRAIYDSTVEDSERDIAIERFNTRQKIETNRQASYMLQRKAKASMLAGVLEAGSKIVQGVSIASSQQKYG